LIAIKLLKPKGVIAFLAAMLIAFTIVNAAFVLLYGSASTMLDAVGGLGQQSMILQGGTRGAVYVSQVPLNLAESFNKLPGVKTRAMTLTPCTLKGQTVVVRGVRDYDDYQHRIVQGVLPIQSGSWMIVGMEAFKKLNLRLGEIVVIASPFNANILALELSAVYSTGDNRDFEAIVPLDIGLVLAGLPEGFVSAIEVRGMDRTEVGRLLAGLYTVRISHELRDGQLVVLDSTDRPVVSVAVKGPRTENLTLPFGYYTVAYRQSYFTSNLTSFLLTDNRALLLQAPKNETFRLDVFLPAAPRAVLITDSGKSIEGSWAQESWVFRVPSGSYLLRAGGLNFTIPVVGDTVFDPAMTKTGLSNIKFQVLWSDGTEVRDYLIFVKDLEGRLVSAAVSPSFTTTLALPTGEYDVEVSKPPYQVKVRIEVPTPQVTITLPSISNPNRIPLSAFERLIVVAPIEISRASLSLLVGLTVSAILGLAMAITVISVIALLTIHTALSKSAEDNLRLLGMLGAGAGETLRKVGAVTLGLSLLAAFAAACLTVAAYRALPFSLTFLGYGIQVPFAACFIYSTSIAFAAWLLSAARTKIWTAT
jgi:hypothetical protein